jgi:hypothetical protein
MHLLQMQLSGFDAGPEFSVIAGLDPAAHLAKKNGPADPARG